MDQQVAQQIGLGSLALVVGISGWILPFRWNVLRLRRSYARLVSETVNKAIPKVVGTILAIAGAAILIGTATIGKFK